MDWDWKSDCLFVSSITLVNWAAAAAALVVTSDLAAASSAAAAAVVVAWGHSSDQ